MAFFSHSPRYLMAALATLLLLAANRAQAQLQNSELAAIVPADAALYVAVPDLKATYAKYQQTGLGKWIASPGMAKFKASLATTDAVSLTNLQGLFGFEEKFLGQFAAPAVVMALPTKAGRGDIVLLIKVPAADPNVVAALKSADTYLTARKAKKAQLKIEGADFATEYIIAPAVAGDDPTEHVYFSTKGYFGVSSGREGLDNLLKNWPAAPAKSLQTTPGFVAATKPLEGASDLLWYAKPISLTAMFETPVAKRKRGDRPWSVILKNQMFGNIVGVASQLNLLTANADAEFNLFVAAPTPYGKGMRILSWQPGPKLPLPAYLPAGVSELTWINSNPSEQFAAYGDWFDELENDGDPIFNKLLEEMATKADGPKVDLAKEFWGKLSTSTLSVSDANGKPNKSIPLGVRSLTISSVTDAVAVEASLTKFFANDKDVTAEKLPNGKIWWVLPGKSLFIAGQGNNLPKTTTAALIGKEILLGDDTAWVKEMAAKPPLVAAAADPVLAPILKRVDAGETKNTSVRQVARFDESWRASYEAMQAGNKGLATNQSVRMLKMILSGDTSDKFAKNYLLLPAFADVKVYLSLGGASFDSSAEGITGRGFILKPAAR